MSALPSPIEDLDTVGSAARRALSHANGDTAKATHLMASAVRKDSALKRALLDPLIEYACGNAVRKQVQDNRDRVWNAPTPRPGMTDSQRVAALAAGNLLMFPLPGGGKRLGEATRSDVIAGADFYEKQAKDMGHKGRWLRLVAQSVPNDKTVSQSLSDARLRELEQEAAND